LLQKARPLENTRNPWYIEDRMFIPVLITAVFLAAIITLLIFALNKQDKATSEKGGADHKGKQGTIAQEAEKRLRSNPNDVDALIALGDIYYKQQDWKKVRNTYNILCKLPPGQKLDDFLIHFRCGRGAVKCGNIEEALKNFRIAESFNAADYQVQYELGNIEFLRGNYEKAIAYLSKSRLINPDYAPAFCMLGHAHFKQKKFQEALVYIKKALELDPGNKETLLTLAGCYGESGQLDQALRIYTHLRADPESGPHACRMAGRLHMASFRTDEAIADFEIGLKHTSIKPDIAVDLHYQLGEAYLRKNDVQKALEHFRVVEAENPDYKDTKKLIGQYAEMQTNENLYAYTMSPPAEFLALCRKIVASLYSQAKIKILQAQVDQKDWADILAEITTNKWSDTIGFRFIRTNGIIGELVVRDFYERLKDAKAGKGICCAISHFSDEATRFTEARLIELVEKPRLITILANLNRVSAAKPPQQP
jgi:tetratricopeptide (TPR) repeat protein